MAWLLFLLVDCLLLLDDLCELDVLLRGLLLLGRLLDDFRELDVLLREVLLDRLLDFLVTFPPLDGFRRRLIAQGIGAGWRSFGVDCRQCWPACG